MASGLKDSTNVKNLVGQTTLQDLFSILNGASLLAGADSAHSHCIHLEYRFPVNLTLTTSNWETGPTSPSGFVCEWRNLQRSTSSDGFLWCEFESILKMKRIQIYCVKKGLALGSQIPIRRWHRALPLIQPFTPIRIIQNRQITLHLNQRKAFVKRQ